MLSAALTRALTTPAFVAADFVPTQCDTAEQKAKFANTLMRFIVDDFPRSKFHEAFYQRLSNTFVHIAHYDLVGFCEHFFLTAEGKLVFLDQCATWPCHGDPTYTIRTSSAPSLRVCVRARSSILSSQIAVERRRRELALLSELKARYEPIAAAPATVEIPDLFG